MAYTIDNFDSIDTVYQFDNFDSPIIDFSESASNEGVSSLFDLLGESSQTRDRQISSGFRQQSRSHISNTHCINNADFNSRNLVNDREISSTIDQPLLCRRTLPLHEIVIGTAIISASTNHNSAINGILTDQPQTRYSNQKSTTAAFATATRNASTARIKTEAEAFASPQYQILIAHFSSGVRLHELRSIALILCAMNSSLKKPSRNAKRSFPLLIDWFASNWALIAPVLPFIQLRDENNEVINGQREMIEKNLS